MSIKKKQTIKFLLIILLIHILIWTFTPVVSNSNLPLDTIEAIAWASDIQWGYFKHPPLSAWFCGLIYILFSNQDWAYYLLSQLFVVFSFIVVWKFSDGFFKKSIFRLISVLLLEGIYFYNFTTPEFNVYICMLPFWALTIFYFWKATKQNNHESWFLLGFFAGLGFLSHYIFFYLLLSITLFYFYTSFKKQFNYRCLISLIIFFITTAPHLIWMIENDFTTITYALHRAGMEESSFSDHFYYPLIFLVKQFGPLGGFLILIIVLTSSLKIKMNFKDKKLLFLFSVSILPIILLVLTSLILGTKIRTMWMTPFYLFFGIFIIYILQPKINLENFRNFLIVFLILIILSPSMYYLVATAKTNTRTNYPGKEIAKLVQKKWDQNFSNKINLVSGNDWPAGNLSYNLKSRPKWIKNIPTNTKPGIVVIGYYDDNIYVNKICSSSNDLSKIVLFQIETLHNVCMVGKK